MELLEEVVVDDHPSVAEVEGIFRRGVSLLCHENDSSPFSIVTQLHDCVLEPAATAFEGQLAWQSVVAFGRKLLEGAGPGWAPEWGGGFAPKPTIVGVAPRTNDELLPVFFANVDEYSCGEGLLVTGHGCCCSVKTIGRKIEHDGRQSKDGVLAWQGCRR